MAGNGGQQYQLNTPPMAFQRDAHSDVAVYSAGNHDYVILDCDQLFALYVYRTFVAQHLYQVRKEQSHELAGEKSR
jgi:hypothetical protein